VVFESRSYSSGKESRRELLLSQDLVRYKKDTGVIYLVDHQVNQEPPMCKAFTVAPVSPDRSNSHQFQ
jgi:hypothetical protein